ncbi:endonuclease [Oceanobacillus iheyensis HTE831]|uniref:Endonuclease n=1 Tax=Oceanobacillus iheyensis (strain DSM 14371 / CIP 107618 / JCM 11309 / KCTC 3954 / HTE831) TaxID=221109 RepID=Q8ETT1_OCEIH|nr:Z1 domain-containing protein [Oceanobacillus iheyensis]BAC12131.1 endonuclease [Oceanobacillus iheyensis HTE831]
MERNSYQDIKNFIYKKLQEVDGVLPQGKIGSEITNTRELINNLGVDIFAKILSVNSLSNLSDSDWNRMNRELETYFDVQMEQGVLVQGEEQQKRDNTWWTSKYKQESKSYYWNRYKEFMKQSLPTDVVKGIGEDTDVVMNNLENPKVESFSRYGMVVGHVQSGKTANYSALLCKAADAGYKFIVVIAGGINNLRNQTQERLNESFVGRDERVPVGVGKLGNLKKELLPISLTTKEQDFNKRDANKNAQGLNFDNIRSPIILVIKKHTRTLTNVIDWLKSQYGKEIPRHAMLLIDDESDYASINTKDEDSPTSINKKIRELLYLFKKRAYVAYTATPYANIFIDHVADHDKVGRDIFPDDFIYSLEAPTNYFGAEKIFLNSNTKYLVEINDCENHIPIKHKKDFDLYSLPESLHDAIRLFIINIGIRSLRGQGNKHNSMLVHATRFTRVHQQISTFIEDYLSDLTAGVVAYGKLKDSHKYSLYIKTLKETFETRLPNSEFAWVEVIDRIVETIETVIIREVHQNTKVHLEYRDDSVTNAIVIGGTSLARGFTLEGLSVSYFYRNTVFYDTLMQMGRWFGYRTDYEDLCRIYMTPTMFENFGLIIEATTDLMDDLKRMSIAKMTPRDFGLSIIHHPDSGLQVTARNKQKNSKDIYFEMKLDGKLKETSWLHKDPRIIQENLVAIREIVRYLEQNKKTEMIGQSNYDYLWRNIDKSHVLRFLNSFKVVYTDPFGIQTRMPIDFIKDYVRDIDSLWDIALYSGSTNNIFKEGNVSINRQKRGVEIKDTYYEIQNRQVSSGTSESICLENEDLKRIKGKSDRKGARALMKKPLLMLHVLEVDNSIELGAFGISFPGGITSKQKTIKRKINTVYIQKLLNEEEYDD